MSTQLKNRKWVYLNAYQTLFSIILAIYFYICLIAYLATLDSFKPKLVHSRNPALMMRPLSQNPHSNLIHFKHGNGGTWQQLRVNIIKIGRLREIEIKYSVAL